jgi:hypothetical protein
MDYHKQTVAFLAGLLLLLPLAGAATQALFESEVVVRDQTPGVRAGAFRTALSEVLVRVAGDQSVLTSEPALALLASPDRLVQQYRYFTEQARTPPALKLWVRFDGDAIRRSLQKQGLAYWGGERPDTLVWLAVEDRGKRYIVSADGVSDVHHQVERAARQRGIPILFPLMDLEDQSRVRFTDIWGGFFDKVFAASERYHLPAVLIGRLHRSPSGGWSSSWHLEVAGRPNAWSDSRQQLEELSRQGIEDVADILAARFAVASNGFNAQTTRITVSGVETLAAYARIDQYLSSLTSVSSARVSTVSPTGVTYELQLNGSLQDLTHTVTIGTVLEPVPGGVPGNYQLRQ